LAGFLGFLICEKFGFELLDSGDFYFLFMYAVILLFSFRLLFKIFDFENDFYNIFSLKFFIIFYNFFFDTLFKAFNTIFYQIKTKKIL
jgi:hypothetical protein